MTKEEFLANRKAAGQVIDVETCKIAWWYAQIVDPYGIESDLPDEAYCIGSTCFVISPDSDGWVCVCTICRRTRSALCTPASNARTKRQPRQRASVTYCWKGTLALWPRWTMLSTILLTIVFRVFRPILCGLAYASRSRRWARKVRPSRCGSSGNSIGLNGARAKPPMEDRDDLPF